MSRPYQPEPGQPPLPPGAPVPPPSGAHIPPSGDAPQLSKQAPSGGTASAPANRDRPFSPKQIAAAIVGILVVVFMAENTRDATVRLLFPEVTVPLFLVIVISVALGALGTFLLMWRKQRDEQRRRSVRRTRR